MAKKVRAYYDKGVLFGITEKPSFYAYPVDVPQSAIDRATAMRGILTQIEYMTKTAGFPRDAQALADFVDGKLANFNKSTRSKTNVKRNDA